MRIQSPSGRIGLFLALTALFSAVFYAFIAATGHVGGGGGAYELGLMWSPAVAALVTCRLTGLSMDSLGWRWGAWRWQWMAVALPLGYVAVAYAAIRLDESEGRVSCWRHSDRSTCHPSSTSAQSMPARADCLPARRVTSVTPDETQALYFAQRRLLADVEAQARCIGSLHPRGARACALVERREAGSVGWASRGRRSAHLPGAVGDGRKRGIHAAGLHRPGEWGCAGGV